MIKEEEIAKEKAQKLINKFQLYVKDTDHNEEGFNWTEWITNAKQCALVCVEEMLAYSTVQNIGSPESEGMREQHRKYWNEVKTHLS